MNMDRKGMDPELAKIAMGLITSKKEALVAANNNATEEIKENIVAAFPGAQTTAMQTCVDGINEAIKKLYEFLDGNESNFAKKFNEVIKSYEDSDANVAATYSSELN